MNPLDLAKSALSSVAEWYHHVIHTQGARDLKSSIISAAMVAFHAFESTVAPELLTIALGVLTGNPAVSWSVQLGILIQQAEAAGAKLAKEEAAVILNFAQSKLIASGIIPAPTPVTQEA